VELGKNPVPASTKAPVPEFPTGIANISPMVGAGAVVTPFPESWMVCTVGVRLSVKVSTPVRNPTAVGLKLIVIPQIPRSRTGLLHEF
jgi:hypothetical protein